MTLNNKLEEIVQTLLENDGSDSEIVEFYVECIKQAFAGEDYVILPIATPYKSIVQDGREYITGKEWLSRFEKYYVAISFTDNDTAIDVLAAAQKASEIEGTNV